MPWRRSVPESKCQTTCSALPCGSNPQRYTSITTQHKKLTLWNSTPTQPSCLRSPWRTRLPYPLIWRKSRWRCRSTRSSYHAVYLRSRLLINLSLLDRFLKFACRISWQVWLLPVRHACSSRECLRCLHNALCLTQVDLPMIRNLSFATVRSRCTSLSLASLDSSIKLKRIL